MKNSGLTLDKFDRRDTQQQFIENLESNEWLSTKEASRYLRITPNALRIQVCRGKVKVFKFGSHNRFRVKDLKHLLLKQGGAL